MKKGFLTNSSRNETITKKIKRPPMMFKMDFTIDTNDNFRIYELGHPFSNHAGGLDDSIYNLIKKLNSHYKHVYISGDYYETWTYRIEFIQKGERPPEYVPIDELIDIRTENSIVIVRSAESPTYYTPYCVQQELRKSGSALTVFGAEPLACISAYEKIIMQRIQTHAKVTYPVPSALINVLPGQDVVAQFQSQMLQQGSRFSDDNNRYIIKPAFSSCGWGVQYGGTAAEVTKRLQQVQKKYTVKQENYQRTAEDFIGMLFIGDNEITDLQQRKEKVLEFVENNDLRCLTKDFDMRPNPDPFFIVQQLVFTPCIPHEGQQWMPTYRTFILIEDRQDSVKISLLEKSVVFFPKKPLNPDAIDTDSIVAGISTSRIRFDLNENVVKSILQTLNNEENKSFFNVIFRKEANFIVNTLIPCFPELRQYWQAIIHYPPYQKILNQNQNQASSRIRKYENLVMIYKIQRLLVASSANRCYLSCLVQLVDIYRKISSKNLEGRSYLDFFSKTAQEFIMKIDDRNLLRESQGDYLKILLGLLMIDVHLLQYAPQSVPLKRVKLYLEKVVEIFFSLYPCASNLYLRNLDNPDDPQFQELIQEKHARNTIIEYTGKLCMLENILKEKCLPIAEIESVLHEQKNSFVCWSMFYFQGVSIAAAPMLKEVAQPK